MGDDGYMDAAAVPVPDAGDTLSDIDLTAVKVLIAHQRRDIGSCICGWGVDAGNLGQSHALHVWRQLQAAGVDRRMAPDAGDETLRERLIEALRDRMFRGGNDTITSVTVGRDTSYPESLADALLPLIRDRIAAARYLNAEDHSRLYRLLEEAESQRDENLENVRKIDDLRMAEIGQLSNTINTLRSYAEARSKSTSEAVRLTAEGVLQILDREADR